MKCSAPVVSVRGKVATGGKGVESVLRVLQALHCIECASCVLRVCFEGVESVLQAAGSVSSVAHKQLLLDQPSFKDPSVSQ